VDVGARRANKVGEEAAVAPLFRAASEGGAGPARRRVLLRITNSDSHKALQRASLCGAAVCGLCLGWASASPAALRRAPVAVGCSASFEWTVVPAKCWVPNFYSLNFRYRVTLHVAPAGRPAGEYRTVATNFILFGFKAAMSFWSSGIGQGYIQ
jgi:hypothetical protein